MQTLDTAYRATFLDAYLTCALWASSDTVDTGNGEPEEVNLDELGREKLHPSVTEQAAKDCEAFIDANAADLLAANDLYVSRDGYTGPDLAGHDFWLTRNGHGAGYWDRGLEEVGERLTAACGWRTAFPGVDLYIGDDGMIYAN